MAITSPAHWEWVRSKTYEHILKQNCVYFPRMSLENHIKNGSILPIGHLVCGFCKDKHLKGIDTSSSQIITQDQGINFEVGKPFPIQNSVSNRPATSSTSLKRPSNLRVLEHLVFNFEHSTLSTMVMYLIVLNVLLD